MFLSKRRWHEQQSEVAGIPLRDVPWVVSFDFDPEQPALPPWNKIEKLFVSDDIGGVSGKSCMLDFFVVIVSSVDAAILNKPRRDGSIAWNQFKSNIKQSFAQALKKEQANTQGEVYLWSRTSRRFAIDLSSYANVPLGTAVLKS